MPAVPFPPAGTAAPASWISSTGLRPLSGNSKNALVVDQPADAGRLRFDQRSLRVDFDGLRNRADLQRDVDGRIAFTCSTMPACAAVANPVLPTVEAIRPDGQVRQTRRCRRVQW